MRTFEEVKKEQDEAIFQLGIFVIKQRQTEQKILDLALEAEGIKELAPPVEIKQDGL